MISLAILSAAETPWFISCTFCEFFFFQAEDGIRDTSVTGVQTCALPISGAQHRLLVAHPDIAPGQDPAQLAIAPQLLEIEPGQLVGAPDAGRLEAGGRLQRKRSEERRVGKECRCRWWANH